MTTVASDLQGRNTASPPPVVPDRRVGRWIINLVVLAIVVLVIRAVASNRNFEWGVVGHYFLSSEVVQGLILTLELTALAMLIGITLGTILAIMRQSGVPILTAIAFGYAWVFRGTPTLVQLVFWFNLASLYPTISLGIPFGPSLFSVGANQAITPLTAALLGLGLNQAAYTSEVVRAGLASVDQGQIEAATSLGMSHLQTLWRITLPQAMRVIIPPIGNETIGMLKTTSLASVISLEELLQTVTNIYSRTYQTIPLLIVASLWYLLVTSILTIGQYYLERYFQRGSAKSPPPSPLQKLRAGLSQLPLLVGFGRTETQS